MNKLNHTEPPPPPGLARAQEIILYQIKGATPELLPLAQINGRVLAKAVKTPAPIPAFNQSLMDGYAVCDQEIWPGTSLAVIGEVAAGDWPNLDLKPGHTLRVYTGAYLPKGTRQVIPMESVMEDNDTALIRNLNRRDFIKKAGSEFRKGQVIGRQGREVTPEHAALLARAGIAELEVAAKPMVHVLCTGSELRSLGEHGPIGTKTNVNSVQLEMLIADAGGQSSTTTCPDDRDAIDRALTAIQKDPAWQKEAQPLLLTTGGLGPGKYDLVEAALTKIGTEILFNGIKAKPGQRCLFGRLGHGLIISLPGPPPAVHTLFNALVRPALAKGLGYHHPKLQRVEATLVEPITVQQPGLKILKPGLLSAKHGQLTVRPVKPLETANVIIPVPAKLRHLAVGTSINVHVISRFQTEIT